MRSEKQTRREFLENVALGIAGGSVGVSLVDSSFGEPAQGEIPYRTLGRTGEKVSLVGLGGYHIGVQRSELESIRIVRIALDNGINFLDNCWDYNDGRSEIRMGKALKDGYRKKAFQMYKVDGRTKESTAKQIDESLRRFGVETIDLMQFHEVVRMEDPDRIFAPDGGIEAMYEARKAGKIRYIGFTGHQDPDIHLKMLRVGFAHGFTPDTVQMPLNVMDPHYKSFGKKVLPVLVEHGIGVLGMKPLADAYVIRSKTVSPLEALHYAMNLPTSVVITGCDSLKILDQALTAARTFEPLSHAEVASLLAKTAAAGADGKYEPFKSTRGYNATDAHPEWLG